MAVTNKKRPYSPDKIIRDICICLVKKGEPQTPSSIAKCINTNPKTAQKYVKIAKNLGIIQCDEIKMGRNRVQLCRINEKYLEIFKELKWRDIDER